MLWIFRVRRRGCPHSSAENTARSGFIDSKPQMCCDTIYRRNKGPISLSTRSFSSKMKTRSGCADVGRSSMRDELRNWNIGVLVVPASAARVASARKRAVRTSSSVNTLWAKWGGGGRLTKSHLISFFSLHLRNWI